MQLRVHLRPTMSSRECPSDFGETNADVLTDGAHRCYILTNPYPGTMCSIIGQTSSGYRSVESQQHSDGKARRMTSELDGR